MRILDTRTHQDFSVACRSECQPPPNILFGHDGPTLAYLELTPACNSRCPGCLNESFISDFQTRSLKHEFRQQPLGYEGWMDILSRIPASVTSIILSGGEPTLHPDFEAIITDLDTHGLDFVLFTNGRWRNPEQLISQLSMLSHFQGFLISLHGASAATHEVFTGVPGCFTETVRNIRQATQAGLPVTISTVITRQNLHELEATAHFALEVGAEEITFNRYLLTPDRIAEYGNRIQVPSPSELKIAVAQIEALRGQLAHQIRIGYGPCIPQCFTTSASLGCSAGEASFVVDPWGNLKPCLHTELLAGSLLNAGFDILWDSQTLTDWRGLFDEGCSSCAAFSQCGGGCRAMALASGSRQDPLMTSPLHETPQFPDTSIHLLLPSLRSIS